MYQRTRETLRSFHEPVDQETRLLQRLIREGPQKRLHFSKHRPEAVSIPTPDDLRHFLRGLQVDLSHRRRRRILHFDGAVEIRRLREMSATHVNEESGDAGGD